MPKLSICCDSNCRTGLPVCLDLPMVHCLSTIFPQQYWEIFSSAKNARTVLVRSMKSIYDLSVQRTMILKTVHIYKYLFIKPCFTFKRWGLLLISLQAFPKAVISPHQRSSHTCRSRIGYHHPLPTSGCWQDDHQHSQSGQNSKSFRKFYTWQYILLTFDSLITVGQ